MQERVAQAGLVVAQLGLGDAEVLPDACAFGPVGLPIMAATSRRTIRQPIAVGMDDGPLFPLEVDAMI